MIIRTNLNQINQIAKFNPSRSMPRMQFKNGLPNIKKENISKTLSSLNPKEAKALLNDKKALKKFTNDLAKKHGIPKEKIKELENFVLKLLKQIGEQSAGATSETKTSKNKKTTETGAASKTSGGGHTGGTSNQFLWKPQSESNGNLVVLLPANMSGNVKSLEVLSPDGSTVLASGQQAGIANGGREHFRFNKPGASFPDGALVKIQMKDGSSKTVKIGDSAGRNEKNSL